MFGAKVFKNSATRWSRPKRDWVRIGQETNYYGVSFHVFGNFVFFGDIVTLPDEDEDGGYSPPVRKNPNSGVTVRRNGYRTQAGQAHALVCRLTERDGLLPWFGYSASPSVPNAVRKGA